MFLSRRQFLNSAAGSAAATWWSSQASAQTSNVLTVKVGYAAGGGADIATRKMTANLAKVLGQTVIVENQGGASGSVATSAYLRLPPSGANLLGVTGDDAILAPLNMASVTYRQDQLRLVYPLRFVDVVLITAHDKAPVGVEQFAAAVKDMRQPPTFGNWGTGSTPHLAAADLRSRIGVQGVDVPYRGQAPVIQDLLGKQIDYAFVPLNGPSIDLIKAGKVKAVFIASAQRNPSLPDIPAAGESKAISNFLYRIWPAIFTHSGTPNDIVSKLHKSIAEVVHSTYYQQWCAETGSGPFQPMSAGESDLFYKKETERMKQVVKAIGLKPQ